MKWYITGDCHGNFLRFENLPEYKTDKRANIICLGDFGINYYLNKTDVKNKKWFCEKYSNFTFYILRGNHEARPTVLSNIEFVFDYTVKMYIWYEVQYPNIRYLHDGGIYSFGNYKCLCIGGAYSVDKYYRLARSNFTEDTNKPERTGWFNDEQLTKTEMNAISQNIKDEVVDFVFTHTCPISFQPSDLFLNFVDQSRIDNSMELWLDKIKDTFDWKIWCFGHYHADRLERPYVEQYFNDIEELDVIWDRWDKYQRYGSLDWWLNKSPNFYMGR